MLFRHISDTQRLPKEGRELPQDNNDMVVLVKGVFQCLQLHMSTALWYSQGLNSESSGLLYMLIEENLGKIHRRLDQSMV